MLVAGETGIGKSTLMDTLFNNNFDSTPSTHDLPDVKLKSRTYGMINLTELVCFLYSIVPVYIVCISVLFMHVCLCIVNPATGCHTK